MLIRGVRIYRLCLQSPRPTLWLEKKKPKKFYWIVWIVNTSVYLLDFLC